MEGLAVPVSTAPSFQPMLYASCMETFMPWPSLGEWVWTASPARNIRFETLNLGDIR